MLKKIMTVIMVLMVIISLSACGSNPIVGRWESVTIAYTGNPFNSRLRTTSTFYFHSNGTIIQNVHQIITIQNTGTWSTDGEQLTTTGTGLGDGTFIFNISGNTLTINPGQDNERVLTRVQ